MIPSLVQNCNSTLQETCCTVINKVLTNMLNDFHKCLPKDQTIFEYVQYYKPIPYQPLRKAASLDSKSKSSIPELHVTTNNLDKFTCNANMHTL